jgi:hypothetical protein
MDKKLKITIEGKIGSGKTVAGILVEDFFKSKGALTSIENKNNSFFDKVNLNMTKDNILNHEFGEIDYHGYEVDIVINNHIDEKEEK